MRRALLPLAVLAAVLSSGCGESGGGGGASGSGPGRRPARPVTLVLDFTPNAAHAGIYEAVARGRDRAHGIRLTVRQPSASTDSLKLLTVGRAQLAVADIHDLGLARERGEDLVGVGALVQRPLAAVIAGPAVARPRQLVGRRVGVTGLPSDIAVLRAVVQGDGGDPSRVRTITIGFSAVPSLLAHRVDAATAFWSVEGVTLRRRGLATHEFRVDSFGAPRYPELVLVVRRVDLKRDPKLVRHTLAALEDGTRDALADRPAAVKEVASAAQAKPDLIAAELDAIAPALSPPIKLNPQALAGWASFDARFGVLKRPPAVGQTFDTSVAP
jgi:putative hydroxymethylpyrimidine transport system substrate-binding protein